MSTQIEVKFLATKSVLKALRTSPLVRALKYGKVQKTRSTATFYDTPTKSLAHEHISLQLREEKKSLSQVVNWQVKDVNARASSEIIRVIDELVVFPALTGEGELDRHLKKSLATLRPSFRLKTKQRKLVLRRHETSIELTIEHCTLSRNAENGQQANDEFSQARFSLLDGSYNDFHLVVRLCLQEAKGKFFLNGLSDYQYANSLNIGLTNGTSTDFKLKRRSSKVVVSDNDLAGDVLSNSLKCYAGQIAELVPEIRQFRSAAAVKQLRVTLRRLRSVELVFREDMRSRELRRIARKARKFSKILGVARDWDVFVNETLPQARPQLTQQSQSEEKKNYLSTDVIDGLALLRESAEKRQRLAWCALVDVLASQEFTSFVLDILEAGYVEAWRKTAKKSVEKPVLQFSKCQLDTRLRDAHKVSQTLDELTPAAGHPIADFVEENAVYCANFS